MNNHPISRFSVELTNLVYGVVEILLSLRFLFRLFAANSAAPFVEWLYRTSGVLISPFRDIFQEPVIDGRFVFDVTALIALVVYSLVFSLILRAFNAAAQS